MHYGSAPANDELEVTVIGPGFGEAIVVHLGDNEWLLVDSCREPKNKRPAALDYLAAIKVSADRVRAIVASHWHDDHVRGIAQVADECKFAEFHLSATFEDDEALALLIAYGGQLPPRLARGTKELYEVIRSHECYTVHHRSIVLEKQCAGREVRVTAFSPTQAALQRGIANLAQHLPSAENCNIKNIVPLAPNMEAVALHLDFGDDAILLGSDLENHLDFGWPAIAKDGWSSSRRKASAFKIAHHGSHTGDADCIWSDLLVENPTGAVTPFNLGRLSLPTQKDIDRLKGRTSELYLSSGAKRKPQMDAGQLKRLSDIAKDITVLNSGFGAVRLRKPLSAGSWRSECFGDARRL